MKTEIFDLENITEEQTAALHRKYLEILKYFDDICTKNSLTYFLCGGTMIGAVREKGFVPWDDDVDLFMPRKDYERLMNIWNEVADGEKYFLARTDLENNYHHAGMSIRDTDTTFINKHSINEDIVHAIGIEIMPIDGAPKGKIPRFFQLVNAFMFALFNTQRLPDNKGKAVRFAAKCIYVLVPGKKLRYKFWKRSERKMSKYDWDDCAEVTELVGSIKGMLIRHPKEDMSSTIRFDFEDLSLPVMKGYDRYLSLIFGNYMELPPVDQRKAKHDTVYINTEVGYTQFKHKYYLIDENNT